jgi:calcium-dependent protein kinase
MQKSYKNLEKLGAGAFGAVYKAEALATGENVAIKNIALTDVAEDMNFVYAELEAMLHLHHPNVVKFFEYFEEESSLWIVTEICTAGDFSELNHGIDDPAEVKLLIRDMVMAMAYCHDHGVAHRDLKFENCLIALSSKKKQRFGKVIDFGLSAIRRPGDKGQWLNDQLGTRYFVAPEVIDQKTYYDVKCDCWSMGVMLYIILTDEHPCCPDAHRLDTTALFRKILAGRIRDRPLQDAKVEPAAQSLVKRLLDPVADTRMDASGALRSEWLSNVNDSRHKTGSILGASPIDASRRSSWFGSGGKAAPVPPTPMSRSMLKRLAAFKSYSKFERAVLTLIAHRSEDSHCAELREAFHQMDTSRNGTLSRHEVQAGIRQCGQTPFSEGEFEQIFDALDADGTGKVHYTEWIAATMKPSHLATDNAIKQVYAFLDLDKTGKISPEELHRVLGCADSVREVLDKGDRNGDNHMNEQEFSALMRSTADRMERETEKPGFF